MMPKVGKLCIQDWDHVLYKQCVVFEVWTKCCRVFLKQFHSLHLFLFKECKSITTCVEKLTWVLKDYSWSPSWSHHVFALYKYKLVKDVFFFLKFVYKQTKKQFPKWHFLQIFFRLTQIEIRNLLFLFK